MVWNIPYWMGRTIPLSFRQKATILTKRFMLTPFFPIPRFSLSENLRIYKFSKYKTCSNEYVELLSLFYDLYQLSKSTSIFMSIPISCISQVKGRSLGCWTYLGRLGVSLNIVPLFSHHEVLSPCHWRITGLQIR